MEYPFKDLMPLDEVLEREGYYKDWTHLDPKVFYSLTQISEYIKTKGYGVDVRLLIAQLAEHFGLKTTQVVDLANLLQQKFTNLEGVTQSFTNNINSLVAQMEADKDAVIANATVDSEVILARGGKTTLGQRLDETDTQLAETKQEIESRIVPNQIVKPSDFGQTPPFNIFFLGDRFVTDYDIKSEAPTGQTYYVDAHSGSDSNDGLSPDSALLKLETALNKTDVAVIKLAPGLYTRAETSSGIMRINKSISIICETGRAELSKHDRLTYSQNETYPYVYEAPLANVLDVVDTTILDINGDYTLLDEVSSVGEVNAHPNSYYCDGSKIYVRTVDSRALSVDDTVRALRAPEMFIIGNGITAYFENIDIAGGSSNIRTTVVNTRILAKNCTFKYAGTDNALTILGGNHVFDNCVTAKALKDGFNYHIINNNFPKAIEIDCVGRNNGRDGTNLNNGSTTHDGGSIIRINGEYYGNEGLNIADIAECESWNLGTLAHTSKSRDNFRNSNFFSACKKMYMEKCQSYGSLNDLTLQPSGDNTSYTYIKHFYSTGKRNIKDNAEVLEY